MGTANEEIFELENYVSYYNSRISKQGGGVAIFVHSSLECITVDNLTKCVDNCAESLCVEITLKNCKKIFVSCIYRFPSTPISSYIEFMESFYVKSRRKTMFLCGDFNINLLKYEEHIDTNNFTDQLFIAGFHPLITRPTRITCHSGTLIDNIFTNELKTDIQSGIIINDISDHLPVFQICDYVFNVHKVFRKPSSKRLLNKENIDTFSNELMNVNWDEIISTDDVNLGYDNFIKVFKDLYNECCPYVPVKNRHNYRKIDKPWFTKSLRNACSKKNCLYKRYLKSRTKDAEVRYKMYKNKLTAVLRYCEKQYYTDLLQNCKNNIRETWKVLKKVIGNENKKSQYPSEFKKNNNSITGNKNIAEEFNNFFVNIGPQLARGITKCKENCMQYLSREHEGSMFLEPVTETEVFNVVNKFTNKTSKGYDDIDMTLLKNVIHVILYPIVLMCNKSLESGVFPDSMKTAKVIPLFKKRFLQL